MPSDISIEADQFAMALDGILGSVEGNLTPKMQHIVDSTCEYAKDVAELEAPRRYGGYSKGFAFSTKKKDSGVVGEVGNRKYPGLVHLLELGHAKTGGGRVAGKEHMLTAYEEAAKMMEALSMAAIDEALY